VAGNPPVDVQQYGQSIWLDFISRKAVEGGEFQRRIDEDGVVGVTSNPTIFQKAIGGSDDYDASIQHMLDLDPYAIFEELALEDIQHALDLFRPIYDRTGGVTASSAWKSRRCSPMTRRRRPKKRCACLKSLTAPTS